MTGTEAGDISKDAVKRIQRFIGHKPRTINEVRGKLISFGYSDDVTDEVIGGLVGQGVLDDKRFTAIYAEELLRKKYGYKRIIMELSKKGIGKDILDSFKENYPHETEMERAREACLSRIRRNSTAAKTGNRANIIGYLMRRGFPKNIAEEAFRSTSDQV